MGAFSKRDLAAVWAPLVSCWLIAAEMGSAGSAVGAGLCVLACGAGGFSGLGLGSGGAVSSCAAGASKGSMSLAVSLPKMALMSSSSLSSIHGKGNKLLLVQLIMIITINFLNKKNF